jgi:ribosomal protein S18 acetylase RimI-like enzyme
MKKLLGIFLFSSAFLLSSEHDAGYKYTKNTCNRTYWNGPLCTDKEREECGECRLSRFEVYDNVAKKHIAHIAYKPLACSIAYLLVDEEHRGKGIGTRLADEAINDMRMNHNCGDIFLISAPRSEKFWERLGAESRPHNEHVFPGPSLRKPLLKRLWSKIKIE